MGDINKLYAYFDHIVINRFSTYLFILLFICFVIFTGMNIDGNG